jgi:hypothetical protein
VTRWNPKQSLDPSLENQQAYAMIENDVLRDGSPVIVTSTHNHLIHSSVHLKAATDAVNSIQKGGDPMQVLAFLDAAGAHTGDHLQRLAGDPMRAGEAQMLSDQLKQLGDITDQLRKQAQQARQQMQQEMERRQLEMEAQQQKTQQVLTDEQIRQLEAQNKIQLSREKAEANMQLRQQVHEQRMRIQELESMQGRAIQDAQAATDIRTKTAKTASEIASKNAKSKTDVDTGTISE